MEESKYDEEAVILQNWDEIFRSANFDTNLESKEDEPINVSIKKSEKKVNFDANRIKPKINLETLNDKLNLILKLISSNEEKVDQLASELTSLTSLCFQKLSSISEEKIYETKTEEKIVEDHFSKTEIKEKVINVSLEPILEEKELIVEKSGLIIEEPITIVEEIPISLDENRSFKPFYNKENYTCTDNYTLLTKTTLSVKVIILGDSDTITIYPFGKNVVSGDFQEWSYQGIICTDISYKELGIIYFNFTLKDNIYIMEPDSNYYEDTENNKIPLSSLDRPFIVKIECKLE